MWPFTSISSLVVSLLMHLHSRGLLVVYYQFFLASWYRRARARPSSERDHVVQHGEDLKLTQMSSD